MTERWTTPEDAAHWAVKVLGDIHVSTSEAAANHDTKAGIGLSALLQTCEANKTCSRHLAQLLWRIVDQKQPPTEEQLTSLSAASLLITDDIILTIQHLPREEQILTVSKLAEDIAVQNMLDTAFMMRRILQAGLQVQEVQNLKPALTMVKFALKKLDDDIHSLAFESEVRKKMMTNTLKIVMEKRLQALDQSQPSQAHEQPMVKNGAIYPLRP